MAAAFAQVERRPSADWFATCDPGRPLGSGGGTIQALRDALQAESPQGSWSGWLAQRRRVVVHSGGLSRRLPAYAILGKALMPIPAIRGSRGQSPDQRFVDIQAALADRILEQAPQGMRVLVMTGDATIRLDSGSLRFPDADVVCLGMRTDPETAQKFGAFFVDQAGPGELAFFRQKPPPEESAQLMARYDLLLDTGLWLFSERAIRVLAAKCGWREAALGETQPYELYLTFGLSLGFDPTGPDPDISALKSAVVPVEGSFFHFGTSADLIESVTRMHDRSQLMSSLGFLTISTRKPDQHVQNAAFEGAPPFLPGKAYWVENSTVPGGWKLLGSNVITGVPPNDWSLELAEGVCLEVVPLKGGALAVRPYGFEDAFRGAIGDRGTLWLNRPLGDWLAARGLSLADLCDPPETDLHEAHLFPALSRESLSGAFVQWMLSERPDDRPDLRRTWLEARRLSASELLAEADLEAICAQRRELLSRSLQAMQRNHRNSAFYSLDLDRSAAILSEESPGFQPAPLEDDASLAKQMHDHMFRSALLRQRGDGSWETEEARAFGALREAIVESVPRDADPQLGVERDQIVWGRSALRWDLAGGWTDTPPYCLLHGGRVLNVAVDLNGQPPVQVFARVSESPGILIRSIDLGTEKRYKTFEELDTDLSEKSEFALAQAALGLAGFLPRFSPEKHASLETRLKDFGGGIELSLLAAVPKGSGLGTSSILASTILATLSELCRLNWNREDVIARTLALEQILSTGGGWQDQVGGCLPGVKVVTTEPGLIQNPTCRWLPDHLLGPEFANRTALLYYTGITRVAKSVLHEIVRGMFLNSGPRLETLQKIGENVGPVSDALQRRDWQAFGEGIDRSWVLNQELDSGTNTPPVQAVLDRVSDYLIGAKLLGAGGGGFLFMVAKDEESARRARAELDRQPPSPGARFFEFAVSQTGLSVTKS